MEGLVVGPAMNCVRALTAIVGACLVAYAMRVLSTKLKYLYCLLVDFIARATVTRLQQTYIIYGRELRVLTGQLRLSAILKNLSQLGLPWLWTV